MSLQEFLHGWRPKKQVQTKTLLIDDLRNPGNPSKGIPDDAVVARTYREGIEKLQQNKWDCLCLDHDLGDFSGPEGRELTGQSVLDWLEQNPEFIPDRIRIVTDNAAKIIPMRQQAHRLTRMAQERAEAELGEIEAEADSK